MSYQSSICQICHKQFYFYTSKTKGKYCSKQCQYIGFQGKNNPNFVKGYEIGKNGYIYEQNYNHPLSDKRGRILQHRRIAYDYLGFLPKRCIIHHLDKDPLNNSIENLAIWNQSDHLKSHNPLSFRYNKEINFKEPIKQKPIPLKIFHDSASIHLNA